MSGFLEILKCLLCCEQGYHDRERNRGEYYYDTFLRNPAPSHPLPQSNPQTVIQSRVHNPPPIVQTPPSAPPRVQTPSHALASPRVHTPPRAPPRVHTPPQRVPVIPVNEVFGGIDVAESVSLSLFDSYPPPSSSSSSRSSVKPPQLAALSDNQSKPSPKPALYKTTLAPASGPSNLTNQEGRANYKKVEKDPTLIYVIPKDIADQIKRDIVPDVLRQPLSPSTYEDYFGALLYAEDFYIEKWSNYLLNNVTVEFHKSSIYRKDRNFFQNQSDDKTFVAFEVDSVPGRRPFLLSRDLVYLQPSGTTSDPFEGIVYRVVTSNTVLVEFGEDFYSKHYPSCKYNVSFSFNRFCLKQAHQAIQVASDPAFQKFLFPEIVDRDLSSIASLSLTRADYLKQSYTFFWILSLNSPPPYLVEGQLSVLDAKLAKLSNTGLVVKDAIVHIHRTSPNSRILVCAPTNNTCDAIMRNLKMEIGESDMFRANAAFQEIDGVPVDVLPSCHYRDECFTCPSLENLRKFKVVLSTYVNSSRLKGEGIGAGHFSHIFFMDASCITEPEVMVALANLANNDTAVVVTGIPRNCSNWVRSNIARQNGLRVSYFERLRESSPYNSLNPKYISQMIL